MPLSAITSTFTYVLKYKKVIGLLVLSLLVVSILAYISHLRSNISDLNTKIEELNTVIASNKVTITTLTKTNSDKDINLNSIETLLETCNKSKVNITTDIAKIDTIITTKESTESSKTNLSSVVKENTYEVLTKSQSVEAVNFINDQLSSIK